MSLYQGQPDARMGGEDTKTSRFRPKYRQLSQTELQLHNAIKEKAAELEVLFEQTLAGRERSIAFTKLEESVMWVIKGLTA